MASLDDAVDRYLREILTVGAQRDRRRQRVNPRRFDGSRPAEVIGVTTSRIAEQRVSADGQEGMRAFLEKRKPKWVR